MQRVLVVYNPVSGLRFLRASPGAIHAALKKHRADVTWVDTQPDIAAVLKPFMNTRFDRIIVIGGDGTVRGVAEVLLAAGNKTPMAILAQGSANILATSLGIPLFPLSRSIRFALKGPSSDIDVLYINKRHICLIGAGQGYDTLFIDGASRALKRHIGPLAYAWSFGRTFLPYRSKRYTIIVDGVRHHVIGKLALALNAFRFAGIPLERSISARDGLIDVFIFNPRTVFGTIRTAVAVLTRRPRHRIPRLASFQGRRVSIRQRKGRHIQIDGEIYRDKHLDIELRPRALCIVHVQAVDDKLSDA